MLNEDDTEAFLNSSIESDSAFGCSIPNNYFPFAPRSEWTSIAMGIIFISIYVTCCEAYMLNCASSF